MVCFVQDRLSHEPLFIERTSKVQAQHAKALFLDLKAGSS